MKNRKNALRIWIFVALLVLLLVAIVPLFSIAQYDYPVDDDQWNGLEIQQVYAQTGSLPAVLKMAAEWTGEIYRTWQGTFSAVFLFALHPGVFGLSWYALTPYLMLGALIVSTFLFSFALFRGVLKTDGWTPAILSGAIAFVSIELMPSAREGIFVYNSGMFYTLFYSAALILFACAIGCLQAKTRGKALLYGILMAVLAAFVSGGNYATALPCVVLLGGGLLYGILAKRKQAAWLFAVAFALFAAGFAISLIAPGNALRAAYTVEVNGYTASGPIQAIALSLLLALATVMKRFDMGSVVVILLTVGLAAPYLKRSAYTFRYPAIVVCGIFCVFAMQYMATVYTATSPGPLRQRNIIWFSYLWMLVVDTLYLTGYAIRLLEKKEFGSGVLRCCTEVRSWLQRRIPLVLLSLLLLIGSTCMQYGLEDTTTAMAVMEKLSGSAQAYGEQRYQILTEGLEVEPEELLSSRILG